MSTHSLRSLTHVVVAAAVAMVGLLGWAGAANAQASVSFDHFSTGYELTGEHRHVRCESCHVNAVFQGTPRDCATCHTTGSRVSAVGKPVDHVLTTDLCASCHTTSAFAQISRFDHTQAQGSCASCHTGTQAKGKPAAHVPTKASCDTCHSTVAWASATFDHSGIAGNCATCHDGSGAAGKPPTHVPTTQSCETCHSTTGWLPATFDHTSIAGQDCASCHNGTTARGKSATHFVTTRACDACHRTTAWTPISTYSHISAAYRAHNTGVTCLSCHKSNNEVIAWQFAAYKPDCAGCHAGTFKPSAHKKVDSPQILYTVSELRNCAGSCHEYTDSTFTTIRRSRTGEHRSTDGGF
jgi:hypothetical protein